MGSEVLRIYRAEEGEKIRVPNGDFQILVSSRLWMLRTKVRKKIAGQNFTSVLIWLISTGRPSIRSWSVSRRKNC